MSRRVRLAAGAVAALVAAGPVPAGARLSGPLQASPGAQVTLLHLLDQTAWVGDGMDFELSVQLAAAPPGSQLQLTVHDRVRSRSEFARSLEGRGLRRRLSGPSPVGVDALDPDGDGTVGLLVPLVAAEGRTTAPITSPGIYPVVVELLDANGDDLTILRTYLLRLPSAGAATGVVPLSVTVVAPLHAPPADLDATTAGPATAPVEDVDALAVAMAAHPDVPVVLAPTPESLAAVDFVDADAVDAMAAALGSSEVLPSPWVDVEEAAWADADAGALARLVARGDQSLSGLLDTTLASVRVVPDAASLAEVTTMVDGGARAVVVHEEDLEPLDPDDFPYTLARPFDLDLSSAADDGSADGGADEGDGAARVVPAVAADRGLGALAAGADDDPVLAAHQLLADLAVIANDEPESARVATLVLPASAARSPAFLDALLSGLEPPPSAPPAVAAATLSSALATVDHAGADGIAADPDDPLVRRLAEEGTVGDVSALADRLFRQSVDIGSYRSVFGPDDPLASRCDDVLATSAAAELDRADRAGALASIEALISSRLAGVQGPASQKVRLTDREGRIQLVLTNVTGSPADVSLHLRGDRLEFPDAPEGVMPVHLVEESTRIELEVVARSSGDAPLDIRLTTPDGGRVLDESRITVRTTAFSGVGVVLMGAAAVFLAVWWTRTILRERRTSRRRHPSHARRT